MKFATVVVVASLAALCGCEKEGKTKSSAVQPVVSLSNVVSSAWLNLSPTSVVVRWGSVEIKKADYERYAAMRLAMMKIRFPDLPAEKEKAAFRSLMASAKNELISRILLKGGLEETNRIALAEIQGKVEKSMARRFSTKKKTIDYAQLLEKVSEAGYREDFLRLIREDAETQSLMQGGYSNQIYLAAEDISDSKRRIEKLNAIAAATNKLNFAQAEKALALVRKGGDFAALAERYTQDPSRDPVKEKGGDMGECDAETLKFAGMDVDAFMQTEYWRKISALKDGETSGILESDTGWEIVKMVKRIAKEESKSGQPAFHLARIFFRRAYVYPEQDEEELVEDLKREKREAFLERVSKHAQDKHKLEFPSGAKIFPQAEKKQPKMGMGSR